MLVTATAMAQVILYGSYTMWLMMPYLTEVWGFSITQAAAVINVFDGVVAMLPLGMKFIVNSIAPLVGDFWMLLLSGLSSASGLALVTMSTPPVLATVAGTCSKYEPECIGGEQRSLYYTGLALLAIGMASCLTSLRPYIFERTKRMGLRKPQHIWRVRQALVQRNENSDELQLELLAVNSHVNPNTLRNRAYHWPSELWLYRCNGMFTVLLVALVFWPMPWSLRLGIPVIILASVTVLFLCKPWYHVNDTEGVVIEASQPIGSQIKAIVKTMRNTLLIWPAFIVCGLISSTGNTYFIEQASQMDPRLGHWNVPVIFFLLFYKLIICLFARIGERIVPNVGIAFCLIISTLCCTIAALVERKRLDLVEKYGLVNNPDDIVPLSMFLMLPQCFLLAILDGAFSFSAFGFFQVQCHSSVSQYVNSLTHFVLGLGLLGNVLTVCLVGQVSGEGGKKGWFQHTLNQSRLDSYYWLLSILSAITLAFYLVVLLFYKYKDDSGLEATHTSEDEVEELEFRRLDWFDLLPLRQ